MREIFVVTDAQCKGGQDRDIIPAPMSFSLVLAEDEPDIQLVAKFALKKGGFSVRIVGNGREVLDAVREAAPDAVLLDWMMPEMDGPEACRQLKADPATAHIPVIFLTARSQEAEIQRGLSIGAIGYITKPFDALTIAAQVRQLLDQPA
jgi:CheY-like chemotaxis protein